MRTIAALLLALAIAPPLAAQTRRSASTDPAPSLSFRPFFLVTGQQFSAKTTFDASFGQAFQPFWGGGLELVAHNWFVDVEASRFKKTGQRAFLFNGQAFGLQIPLTATVTPFEIAAGSRWRRWSRVVPYAGAGFGTYAYKETSAFADAGEDVNTRHTGVLVLGGAELRVHRWIAVTGDVQYSHIPGILGAGGLSKDANERDLGGVAVRARVLVGR